MGRKKEKRLVGFTFSSKTEPDLADWLDKQDNKTKSIKFLIRLAIAKYGYQDLVSLGLLHTTLALGEQSNEKTTSAIKIENNDSESTSNPVKAEKKSTVSNTKHTTETNSTNTSLNTERKPIENSVSDITSDKDDKKDPFNQFGV